MTDLHIGLTGVLAGICTTVSFLSPVIKIFKTKSQDVAGILKNEQIS